MTLYVILRLSTPRDDLIRSQGSILAEHTGRDEASARSRWEGLPALEAPQDTTAGTCTGL